MRGPLVVALALVTGCGFSAGGQGSPRDDASAIDAAQSGDGHAVDQMPDSPVGALCPVTYSLIVSAPTLSSRYRFVGGGGQKWIDAENDCADDAGAGLATHLVVLDDTAEATAVIGGLASGGNINDQWIGATDLQAEDNIEYVTAQGTTLTLTPTMNAVDKDCIRLKNSGATEFGDCNETNKYVCECDGQVADPSRFPNLPDGNGNGQ